MRVILTAGGTAGHINPALAIADEIKRREPGSEILFIGRKDGMEKALAAKRGYDLLEIESHGFMRRLTLSNIRFNLKSFLNIFAAQKAAGEIFKSFRPDAVIGCGGYVSGPVVRKAAKMGYPTAIQEQNAYPGITTKLLAKRVDRIFAADGFAARRIGFPVKTEVAGNPIRADFFTADSVAAREKWGAGDRVTVLSYGGSNGARAVNDAALAFIKLHAAGGAVFHIHATGSYDAARFSEELDALRLDGTARRNLLIMEYIDDMPSCYAAADLILSRSGALTVSEIAAAGKASVLIPSPNVTENHQFYNAMSLAEAGAAFVYEEEGLDFTVLAGKLMELSENRAYLKTMGENAKTLAVPDSSGRIYDGIRGMIDEKQGERCG